MEEIIASIKGCNEIRYASYRTAAKMQILYRELHMRYVQLDLVAGVFERHRLSMTENTINLDSSEIEDVLSDIYFAANKEGTANLNVDYIAKLAVSYILNTFDKECTGNVLVFSVKIALVLICAGGLQEKYGYLYQQLADHNACLSRAGLYTLLTNICKITEMLGEASVYGHRHIQTHVDTCFAKCQGCLGVTESEFATWIMQEPILLVWITTFDRMKLAENVIHNVRCSSCKVTPIQGVRYSCLKCTGFSQCQECFLLGRTSNKHKLKHPVREYCIKTSNREITKLIIELIRNKLRLCPTKAIMANMEEMPLDISRNEVKSTDCTTIKSTMKRRILNDPQRELQSIITHLEEENKQLQIELLDIQGSRAERLHRHRATIESQLQRLKILKKYLFTEQFDAPRIVNHLQSTPMVQPLSSRVTCLPLQFELSPIIRQDPMDSQTIVSHNGTNTVASRNFKSVLSTGYITGENHTNSLTYTAEASTSSAHCNLPEGTRIELSTWIGGTEKAELRPTDSGFSQWFRVGESSSKEDTYLGKSMGASSTNDPSLVQSHSPNGIYRDNTPSSLQRPDKHSQHSSLQNIQGDLNDILDRLQNMVANDCLLDESYVSHDNCKLKRATTEMEDLLTGLIEGMESRKSKLTTIV